MFVVPLEIRLKPVETLLFRSDIVAVGRFRCPANHQLFRDSGPCSHHTFVFPRSVTAIRFDDGHAFVASPASVVFIDSSGHEQQQLRLTGFEKPEPFLARTQQVK